MSAWPGFQGLTAVKSGQNYFGLFVIPDLEKVRIHDQV